MAKLISRSYVTSVLGRAGLYGTALRTRDAVRNLWHGAIRRVVSRDVGPQALTAMGRDVHVISVGARRVAARGLDGVTADDVRQRNFELVRAILKEHGVPHLVLPVAAKRRTRIAVPSPHRADAGAALIASAPPTMQVVVADAQRFRRRAARLPTRRAVRRRLRRRNANIWQIFEVYAGATGTRFLGSELACELEVWAADPDDPDGSQLIARRWNRFVPTASANAFTGDSSITALVDPTPYFGDVTFPVDVVYTWVDGRDSDWNAARLKTLAELKIVNANTEAANRSRFESRDELRYSLRSLELFAGFVRHVWLVTADQRPAWLVDAHPRLTVVSHRDIFPCADDLPTFNSHAIEANLHRIEGLAEHYIYMNDDFFFGRRVVAEDFFFGNGLAKCFLSRARMPLGTPSEYTKPVDAAAMNGRALMLAHFGISVTRKFKHAPYPQLKAVHRDLDEWFPDEIRRTSSSKVRSPTDLALASSLHQYAAFATGRAVPANIYSDYVDLARPDLEWRLRSWMQRAGRDTLCLNDSASDDSEFDKQERLVRWFLGSYYPVKSSFEK